MPEIRLPTEQEMVVMNLLLNGKDTYALDLVKKSNDKLSRHSIYTVLMRMVAKGFLADRLQNDDERTGRGPARRLYKITGTGYQAREAKMTVDRMLGKEVLENDGGTIGVGGKTEKNKKPLESLGQTKSRISNMFSRIHKKNRNIDDSIGRDED